MTFRLQSAFERARAIEDSEESWRREVQLESQQNIQPQNGQNETAVQKKSRGRPKKFQENFEEQYDWPDEAVSLLISLWQSHEVLFNPSHRDYHIRDENNKALASIQTSLMENDINVSTKQISNKLSSLKVYFCKERSKIKNSRKSGSGTEDIYKTRWKFYSELQFLDEFITPRQTVSTFTATRNEEDPFTSPPSVRQKRMSSADQTVSNAEKLMEKAVNFLDQSNSSNTSQPITMDDDAVFGDMIARLMRRVPGGHLKDLLKINIQQSILQTTYQTSPQFQKNTQSSSSQSVQNSSHIMFNSPGLELSPYNLPSPTNSRPY